MPSIHSAGPTIQPPQKTQTTSPQTPAVKQEDIKWAIELEAKVKADYEPSAEETSRYAEIAKSLINQETKSPTAEDLDWSLELEGKVKEGYQPTAEETGRYQNIERSLMISETYQDIKQLQTKLDQIDASLQTQATPGLKKPETAESYGGLTDLLKYVPMKSAEFAAEGSAKNMVEMFDSFHDVGESAGAMVDNLKEGKLLAATKDTARMVGNALGGVVDGIQVGLFSTLGGFSLIPALITNGLDQGGEAIGDALEKKESGLVKGMGKIFHAISGKNSHVGYGETFDKATEKGIRSANID